MSLSVLLIPAAIGIASAVSSTFIQEKLTEGTFYRIDTNMKDEIILEEALKNYGCDVLLNEENFQSSLGELQIAFQIQEDETISAIISEDVKLEDAQEFLTEVHSEYTRIVQRQTYEKLLIRAKEEGLILESENHAEDDSIVLTFQVKEKQYIE